MNATDHALRREYALDKAQAEGRIIQASRSHWSAQYDGNPAATTEILARLAAVPVGILGHSVEQTAAAGRVMMRGGMAATTAVAEPMRVEHPRPTTAPAEANLSEETVKGWTHELFRETRAGAGARTGRITRDTKG